MRLRRANVDITRKEDREITLSYRPMSLTCVVFRLLGKIIRKHLVECFNTRSHISARQLAV